MKYLLRKKNKLKNILKDYYERFLVELNRKFLEHSEFSKFSWKGSYRFYRNIGTSDDILTKKKPAFDKSFFKTDFLNFFW